MPLINSSLQKTLCTKWAIDSLEPLDAHSRNQIFVGESTRYGSVVLKVGNTEEEILSEAQALKSFGQSVACRFLEYDLKRRAILVSRIYPGQLLVKETDLRKRVNAFCDLFVSLHGNDFSQENVPCDSFAYQTYKQWVYRASERIGALEAWVEVSNHMQKAKAIYDDLEAQYPTNFLLHGDFHYYNILLSEQGYKLIDPKGVIGNSIFDLPRYMLNEFWDERRSDFLNEKMKMVFDILSSRLNLPLKVLSKLLYIEGALGISWLTEEGADLSEKGRLLETLDRLQGYMRNPPKHE